MKKILAATAVLSLVAASAFANVAGSKHDLSSGGGQTIKGSSDQICIYCHTPHNAQASAPLWNRANAGTVSSKYNSATFQGGTQTLGPQSTSCMTCHDGTVAANAFLKGSGGGGTTTITGNALIGTDLSNDHPVGFVYSVSTAADTDIKAAPAATPLYAGQMECATCHDVHNKVVAASFLRINNAGSNLCIACHNK